MLPCEKIYFILLMEDSVIKYFAQLQGLYVVRVEL